MGGSQPCEELLSTVTRGGAAGSSSPVGALHRVRWDPEPEASRLVSGRAGM